MSTCTPTSATAVSFDGGIRYTVGSCTLVVADEDYEASEGEVYIEASVADVTVTLPALTASTIGTVVRVADGSGEASPEEPIIIEADAVEVGRITTPDGACSLFAAATGWRRLGEAREERRVGSYVVA